MVTELGNHLNLSGFLLHDCLLFAAPSVLRSVCVCVECVGALCGSEVFVLPLLLLLFSPPPVVCVWVYFFCPGDRKRVCVELKGTRLGHRGVKAESFIHTGQHISVSVWCFSPTSLWSLFVGATHPPGCSSVEKQTEQFRLSLDVTGCQDA